tara:strand:+ start:904 stop:1179 length:276 start_codon:yes stop_codon:yes gene_type:complete
LIYKKHIFICTKCSYRTEDKKVLGVGSEIYKQVKENADREYLKEAKIRISESGCLGQCSKGCNVMVYPEGKLISHLNNDIDSLKKIDAELT